MRAEIRRVVASDIPALRRILAQAFGRGEWGEIQEAALENPLQRIWGVAEHGELVSTLTIRDSHLWFGNRTVRCGGLAGVATMPAARGSGCAGRLIRHALGDMRAEGMIVSNLWPFDFGFYRGFGWDYVGLRRKYAVPVSSLPVSAEAKHVVHARFNSLQSDLPPIYQVYAQQFNGMMVRDEDVWADSLRADALSKSEVYLFQGSSGPEGYLVIRFEDAGKTLAVTDMACTSSRAYSGFLALMRRYAMSVSEVKWSAPDSDMLFHAVADKGIETSVGPFHMGRIVDFPAAVRTLAAPELLSQITLRVHDSAAPWNDATWMVSSSGGAVQVDLSTNEPEIEGDIRAFSQAFWGQPSAEDLIKAGRIGVRGEDVAANLINLFPAHSVWLADDF